MIYETLSLGSHGDNVMVLQRALIGQGYAGVPLSGVFDAETRGALMEFQAQHVGESGRQLTIDGVAGPATCWAIEHASGALQRSGRARQDTRGLTSKRAELLDLVDGEHAKNVHENPDGSNRSPDIDRYFAGTGMIGLPWCCAFVTWALDRVVGGIPRELSVHRLFERGSSRATTSPKPGDVFIQLFPAGKGHTGFVSGVSADGLSIYTVEGNCGNRVKRGKRPVSGISHFLDILDDGQGDNFPRGTDRFVESILGGTR